MKDHLISKNGKKTGGATYTIKKGDGLSVIAQKTGVSMATLQSLNGITPEPDQSRPSIKADRFGRQQKARNHLTRCRQAFLKRQALTKGTAVNRFNRLWRLSITTRTKRQRIMQ